MITKKLSLTKNQINSFDRFLIPSTGKVLNVLETMFVLNIDSSASSIEIVPTVDIEKIEHLRSGPLYVISSEMAGELQGRLHLLMRSRDYKTPGEVIKPILKLLFLSNSDADLATLESQKPDWMQNFDMLHSDDAAFHEQMMDTLLELGNVLFGVYTRAIYMIYGLHTYHSLLKYLRDTDQQYIQQILSSPKLLDTQHLVIENEFSALHKPIKLWCLISPTQKSFQEILNSIG